jgi:hypothetical protein
MQNGSENRLRWAEEDVPHQAFGRSVVKDGPKDKGVVLWPLFHPVKKKPCRMFRFKDQRFQPTRGDNAKIRIAHICLTNTLPGICKVFLWLLDSVVEVNAHVR